MDKMAASGKYKRDGLAVQIINCNENERPKLTLNSAALRDVVRGIEQEPVVVLSIAGEYRTGKSFLLNFLIRYLEALEQGNVDNWLKDPDVPLKGFDWAPGSDRTTIGIHLWNKPYLVTLPDQRRVAVLLMDTQGLFDDKTAPEDAATIFALSTMISSIQVYNIMRNIGENHLKHLELFVETGRLVLEEKQEKSTSAEAEACRLLKGETTSAEIMPILVRAEETALPDTKPQKETTIKGETQVSKEETMSQDKERSQAHKEDTMSEGKEPSHVSKEETISVDKEPSQVPKDDTISEDKEPSQVPKEDTMSEDKEPSQVLKEDTMSGDKEPSQVPKEETMSKHKEPSQVPKEDTMSEHKEPSQVLKEDTMSGDKEPSQVPKEETMSEHKELSQVLKEDTMSGDKEPSQVPKEETMSEHKEPSQVSKEETMSEHKEPSQVLKEETMSGDKEPSVVLTGKTTSTQEEPSQVLKEDTMSEDKEPSQVPKEETMSEHKEPSQVLKEDTMSEDKEPSQVPKEETMSQDKERSQVLKEDTMSEDKEPSVVLTGETISIEEEPSQVLKEDIMSEDKEPSQVTKKETMSEDKEHSVVLTRKTTLTDEEPSQVLKIEPISDEKERSQVLTGEPTSTDDESLQALIGTQISSTDQEPSQALKEETISEEKEPLQLLNGETSSAVTNPREITPFESATSATHQVLSEETSTADTISHLTEEPTSIDTKPFQRLVYLVRDWNDPRKHKFGSIGGESYLNGKLMGKENQPEVLRKVRDNIHGCFEQVECFLMPNPGQRATESCASDSEEEEAEFSGKLTELNLRFVKKLEELAPFLLKPGRLHPKQYGTKVLTGRDLCDNILRYMSIFQSGSLPQPTSTKEVMLMEFNTMINSELVDQFKKKLSEVTVTSPSLLANPEACYLSMENEKNVGIETFEKKARGNKEEIKQFRAKLEETLSGLLQAKSAEIINALLQRKETDEHHCQALLRDERVKYEAEMKRIQDPHWMKRQENEIIHEELKDQALRNLKEGMRDHLVDTEGFICKLQENLENVFETLVSQNEARLADMKHREALCENAALQAEQNYKHGMDKICGEGYVDPETLPKQHKTEARNALEAYDQSTVMYPEHADRSRGALQASIEDQYKTYIERNERNRQIQREQYCQQKLDIALLKYTATMEEQSKSGPYKADVLKTLHKSAKSSVISFYQQQTDEHGNDRLPYEEELVSRIQEVYRQYISKNDASIAEQEKIMAEMKEIKAKIKSQLHRDYERLCDDPYRGGHKASANDLKIDHPSYSKLPADMKEELQEILFDKWRDYLDHVTRKSELRRERGEFVCKEAMYRALDKYRHLMEKDCGFGMPYLSQSELRRCHEIALNEANMIFLGKTIDFPSQNAHYGQTMNDQANMEFEIYKRKNEHNNPRNLPDARTIGYVTPHITAPQVPQENTPVADQNEAKRSWWNIFQYFPRWN